MGNTFKKVPKPKVVPLAEQLAYWVERCKRAEKFIEESPCDPDINPEQMVAYQKWNRSKDFGEY